MADHDTTSRSYNELLRKLETTDPVHADTFNPLYEQLVTNDMYLHDNLGAKVENSAANGAISVNGEDIAVYDDAELSHKVESLETDLGEVQIYLDGKANLSHSHALNEITDVDTTNKDNGNALIYDSTAGKYVFMPLPSSTDGEDSVIVEDFSLVSGEIVKLKLPYDVDNLQVAASTTDSVTLQWTPSKSEHVEEYLLYSNSVLAGTTAMNSFTISGLSPGTEYVFKVKSKDNGGILSEGREISSSTAYPYAFKTRKTTTASKIEFPEIEFRYMEIEAAFSPVKNTWDQFFLFYPGLVTGTEVQSVSWEHDGWRISKKTKYVEKMFVNNINVPFTTYDTVPDNTRCVLGIQLTDNFSSRTILLGDGVNITPALVYEVRFYEIDDFGGKRLTARYDFTNPAQTASLADTTGNYGTAAIMNGEYQSN